MLVQLAHAYGVPCRRFGPPGRSGPDPRRDLGASTASGNFQSRLAARMLGLGQPEQARDALPLHYRMLAAHSMPTATSPRPSSPATSTLTSSVPAVLTPSSPRPQMWPRRFAADLRPVRGHWVSHTEPPAASRRLRHDQPGRGRTCHQIARDIGCRFLITRQAADEVGHLRDTADGEIVVTPVDPSLTSSRRLRDHRHYAGEVRFT